MRSALEGLAVRVYLYVSNANWRRWERLLDGRLPRQRQWVRKRTVPSMNCSAAQPCALDEADPRSARTFNWSRRPAGYGCSTVTNPSARARSTR